MKRRNEDLPSQLIPLNKLKKSPRNVRQTPHEQTHIEALADSIEAYGQIQNLVVETERDEAERATGCYLVTAGEGRRLAQLLRVKRKRIKSDAPILCVIDDEHNAQAISLAENELRQRMHPADQFVAFKLLVDSGESIDDVAAHFGVARIAVQQRLKLANVCPEFIALYRERKLSLEHLMALALTDDQAKQREVWKDLGAHNRSPESIRDALTANEILASAPMALFVGLKAYQKAGGPVRRDLFVEDDEGYIIDGDLLRKLAREKLEKHARALKPEGFAWVEVAPQLDYSARAAYGHVKTVLRDPTEEETAALSALHAQRADIENQAERCDGDDEKLAGFEDALSDLDEKLDELQGRRAMLDPDQQALAGAIVTIGRDGKAEILRGLLKPEDAKRFAKSPAKAASTAGDADTPRTHSAAMTRKLTAHRTLALQASVARQPRTALLALTHRLVLWEFSAGGASSMSALQVQPQAVALRVHAPDIDSSKAHAALQAQRDALRSQLPVKPQAFFAWLSEQSNDTLLSVLAFCVAQTINGVRSDDRPGPLAELATAAKLDMHEWWTPTAEGYFSAIPKADILKAVKEGASPETASPLSLLKKTNLAKAAEEKLTGTGWLPSLLRTPEAA